MALPPVLLVLLTVLLAWPATAAGGVAPGTGAETRKVAPRQELVALLRPTTAFAAPRAQSRARRIVSARRPLTLERTTLPVVGRATGPQGVRWLRVGLPGRPNGQTAWIRKASTVGASTQWHLVVELSRRRVIVYRQGRPVRVFRAIVGKPSTPTPRGTFFVEENIAMRAGDAGAPFALALSARSDVLQVFDGGPGQIALHGLSNVGGNLGTAVSHGCVRLANGDIRWLAARIGPGVPVTITR